MYTPKHFKPEDDAAVLEFIKQNGFGTLISHVDGQLWATHLPLLLSADGATLIGHVSRGNKAWKDFNSDQEVLAIFQGAHTYVSSSWYNHENVPTWNYTAVHVYGRVSILSEDQLRQSLKVLTDKYEKDSEHPVTVEKLSGEYMKKALPGIVGFEIEIARIEAAYKLSQNRDEVSYHSIIRELEKRGDRQSVEVAAEMKKNGERLFPEHQQ
jgi:transcriptional regulator